MTEKEMNIETKPKVRICPLCKCEVPEYLQRSIRFCSSECRDIFLEQKILTRINKKELK